MKLEVVNGVLFAKIDEYTYKEYFTFNGVSERIISKIYSYFKVCNVIDNKEVVFCSKSSRIPMLYLRGFDALLKNVSISADPNFDEYGETTGTVSLVVVGTLLV